MKIITIKKEVRAALKQGAMDFERCKRVDRDYLESKILVLESIEDKDLKTIVNTVLETVSDETDFLREKYEDFGISCSLFIQMYRAYVSISEKNA